MRRARERKDNASYYVTCHANRKENIFLLPNVKEMFLKVIKSAQTRFKFRMYNLAFGENHFRLLLQTLDHVSISKVMQWILSVFAIRFNKKFGVTGHVWGERFFSKIVDTVRSFLRHFNLIRNNSIRNPVKKTCTNWVYNRFSHILRLILTGLWKNKYN